jgi:hypothetical protein
LCVCVCVCVCVYVCVCVCVCVCVREYEFDQSRMYAMGRNSATTSTDTTKIDKYLRNIQLPCVPVLCNAHLVLCDALPADTTKVERYMGVMRGARCYMMLLWCNMMLS